MVPPNYVKIFVSYIFNAIQKTSAVAGVVQKIDYLGGFQGSGPKKFRETKLRLHFNNFTQKLDFSVLWFWRKRAYKI